MEPYPHCNFPPPCLPAVPAGRSGIISELNYALALLQTQPLEREWIHGAYSQAATKNQ